MSPRFTDAPSAQSGRRDEPRKEYWSPLWADEVQRAIDKLKPDDFKRFMLIHLVLVEGRAIEPPHRTEAAWQRCVGLRGDHWRRFLDRVIAAGVLSVEADGALSGPWAQKVYAERSKQTDRNRQNRTSAGRQTAPRDRLESGYAMSSNFQTPAAAEKTETEQWAGATADQRPFAKENRKEEVEEPLSPTGENAGGVEGECLVRDEGPLPQNLQMLVDLCADGRHIEVVDFLLRPILQERRFSDADRLGSLLSLRDSAKDLSREQLEKAAKLVLALPFRTIKRERIAEAIDQVRKAGAMVVIRSGTPQFSAWIAHWQRTEPKLAKLAARADKWQAPATWPPTNDRAGQLVGMAG